MSEEQLKSFLEKVKSSTDLQEKLRAAQTAGRVVEIAKECGHHFTEETVNSVRLSEEELEAVSGGTFFGAPGFPPTAGPVTQCGGVQGCGGVPTPPFPS